MTAQEGEATDRKEQQQETLLIGPRPHAKELTSLGLASKLIHL